MNSIIFCAPFQAEEMCVVKHKSEKKFEGDLPVSHKLGINAAKDMLDLVVEVND